MEKHYDLTDLELETYFKSCTLNPTIFNHEAHLRLAWIYITKYGEKEAIKIICTQLMQFVSFVEAKDKYNQTLTIAAVKIVAHFINKSNSGTFQEFISEFPRLKYNFKDLINIHYKFDVFNSEIAKKRFIEPDLEPFD
jgi:hypothetical protein